MVFYTDEPLIGVSEHHVRILLLPVSVDGREMHSTTIDARWPHLRKSVISSPLQASNHPPVLYMGRVKWVKVEPTVMVAILPIVAPDGYNWMALSLALSDILNQALQLKASVHVEPFGKWQVAAAILRGAFGESYAPLFIHKAGVTLEQPGAGNRPDVENHQEPGQVAHRNFVAA